MYALAIATSEEVTTVMTLLKSIASFFFEAVGDVVGIVMSQPLLLIPIGVVMARTIISVFRSLF